MDRYNHRSIEAKWQAVWLAKGFAPGRGKTKKYILDMFPYPSAQGLHVGHPEGYTASDIVARFERLHGTSVLHPMGWDAFGLPAENFAIKQGVPPRQTTDQSIATFKRQVQALGFSYDWGREINTSSPDYYRWTQWLFLQLYKRGLAEKRLAPVNWCEHDQTVLANEQVVDGKCERCQNPVTQKKLEQWFFKTTAYAEELLSGLDGLDWPEPIKQMQRNWIGKSEGAEIHFPIDQKSRFVLLHGFNGNSQGIFFPWLKKSLEDLGHTVITPDLPHPDQPTEREQVEYVLQNIEFTDDTILFGHSLGTVVALKVMQELKRPIAGLVLAGGFSTPRFKDRPRPFHSTFDWNFDWKKIQTSVGFITVLNATNDTAVHLESGRQLANSLGVTLREIQAADDHFTAKEEPILLEHLAPQVTVFTTRPDTIFGATYLVLAPEHPMVERVTTNRERSNVEDYKKMALSKTELQRKADDKEKTGVFTGSYAINPANDERIPIWVADYVLMSYGSGAIMAVPAHDQRDYVFAKRYKLPVRQVIAPHFIDADNPPQTGFPTVERTMMHAIVRRPSDDAFLVLDWKGTMWKRRPRTFIIGGIEAGEDINESAKREIVEETGYTNLTFVGNIGLEINSEYCAAHKLQNRYAKTKALVFELVDESQQPVADAELAKHEFRWIKRDDVAGFITILEDQYFWEQYLHGYQAFEGEGDLVDSGRFTHLPTDKARTEITAWLEKEGKGKATVQYKLRDWLISRQRYWGAPIPIVYCDEHGAQPVPEKDLPVELPDDVDFRPTGESPIARSTMFNQGVTCPECGKLARREVDTMDTFVDSSWYFLRYVDPKNTKAPFDKKKIKEWLPVDLYVGGAEHAVLHLLYARFVTKALRDAKWLSFDEPFLTLKNQGLILGEDGQKMSKSRGNVINPDEIIELYGADSLRLYEMFMGPFEAMKPWQTKGLVGMRRFLDRVWAVGAKDHTKKMSLDIERLVHQTVKKVTEDIQQFRFNTSISSLMVLQNTLLASDQVPEGAWRTFLILLNPFAPHMTEELWAAAGFKKTIADQSWPTYDKSKLVEATVTLIVQVNGKVRDRLTVSAGISQEDAVTQALQSEKIKALVSGTPKKVIFVPDKLINFVV